MWDNTYEEQDSTLKGSFVIDQNSEGEMIENIHISIIMTVYIYIFVLKIVYVVQTIPTFKIKENLLRRTTSQNNKFNIRKIQIRCK